MPIITLLNHMADPDFERSLDKQAEWGVAALDLKDHIYGKALIDLTDAEAQRAADSIAARGMWVYCLSSTLFFEDVENGEEAFRANHLSKLERLLQIARILRPRVVRLLAARTARRAELDNAIPYVLSRYGWLMEQYRLAAEQITDAGFVPSIENEANGCILSKPEEILDFFDALDHKAFFTFDIQNLWQMGVYPSETACRLLSGVTNYFHLKGSSAPVEGGQTRYATSLEDASWPVLDVTRAALHSDIEVAVCLNPVKGQKIEGYDYDDLTRRDLQYIMRNL